MIALVYTVGALGHLERSFIPSLMAFTPWFLLLSGLVVVGVSTRRDELKTVALWLVPWFGITFGIEVWGVATGQVFGPYHYTDVLGTRLWGVPPVVGWNWALVVWGVHSATRNWFPRVAPGLLTPIVGLACVLFDVLLEPVAMGLGYWVWDRGTVPLRNYLAWGVIATAGGWWAGRFPRLPQSSVLGWYVVIQALFFAVLGSLGVKA